MAFTNVRDSLNIILGLTQTRISDGFSSLTIDVTVSERPNFKNIITEKPAEDGAESADMIIQAPIILDMEIIFGDDLIGASAKSKAETIEKWWASGTILEVVTEFRSYPSMVIQEYSVDRTARTSSGAFITISLKEFRFKSTATTPLDSTTDGGLNDTTSGTVDQGSKVSGPSTPETSQTALSTITTFLGFGG